MATITTAKTYNEKNFRTLIRKFINWLLMQEVETQVSNIVKILSFDLYNNTQGTRQTRALLDYIQYFMLVDQRKGFVADYMDGFYAPFCRFSLNQVSPTFEILRQVCAEETSLNWANPENFDQDAMWTMFFATKFNMEDMEMDLRAFEEVHTNRTLHRRGQVRENLIPRIATYVANIPHWLE